MSPFPPGMRQIWGFGELAGCGRSWVRLFKLCQLAGCLLHLQRQMAPSPRLPHITSSAIQGQEMPCLWEARPRPKLDPTWCCVLIAQFFRPQTVSYADEQQLPFGRVVSLRAATTAFFVQQGGQLLVRE